MTQPTHDEVIAWFNTKLALKRALIIDLEKMVSEYGDDSPSSEELLKEANEDYASLLANRDVLERHKPDSHGGECQHCLSMQGCGCCADISCAYPCPTYLDILQRIAEVM